MQNYGNFTFEVLQGQNKASFRVRMLTPIDFLLVVKPDGVDVEEILSEHREPSVSVKNLGNQMMAVDISFSSRSASREPLHNDVPIGARSRTRIEGPYSAVTFDIRQRNAQPGFQEIKLEVIPPYSG